MLSKSVVKINWPLTINDLSLSRSSYANVKKEKNIIVQSIIIVCWLFLGAVSFNHMNPFLDLLDVSTFSLGLASWVTIIITLLYLGRHYLKQIFLVFFSFFIINFNLGPFLEPPGDPIDHLKRTYSFCDKESGKIRKMNNGFWHYSMSSNLLCLSSRPLAPKTILRRIDLLHGIYCGLLAVGLFLLSKSAGLPDRWAYLSGIIAFLFFGTNRFSYFSYYSLAPGFSSLLIYWLWTAAFFFKKKGKDLVLGLLMAIVSVPIIVVNHIQEVIFLGFIVLIWLFLNFSEKIWNYLNRWSATIYILALIVLLYLLPQFDFFQHLISPWFPIDDWEKNQAVVYRLGGFHVMGKIWSFRINDTLGIMGILPLFLGILIFWPNLIQENNRTKINIFVLGILPLLIYTIPLFNFIWVSNCKWKPTHIRYYYRICYSSMFWLSTAFVLYGLEGRFVSLWKKVALLNGIQFLKRFKSGPSRSSSYRSFYFTCSLILILIIGGIRSAPIYGKLDFIFLESRPWWLEWKPMIEKLFHDQKKPVYTDQVTSNVINGIFNMPTKLRYQKNFKAIHLNIRSMDRPNFSEKNRCVINLTGFAPSWVPKETRHWPVKAADTSHYYNYKGIRGIGLKRVLKQNPPKNCDVYD